MYLRRKIDEFLISWKNQDDRLPLIINGARQVGKTESILHFAKNHYENVVYINFIETPKYKGIIKNGYAVDNVVKEISVANNNFRFEPHKTIIIFDEIAEQPDITTALKFFAIDKRYDVICSGSLLGIHYKRIHSLSVGYKTDYNMYSLDFEEFLWAKGFDDNTVDNMLSHMIQGKRFSDLEMETFKSLFLDYVVIGGMPSIVTKYLISANFSTVDNLQKQIVLDYEGDVRKYVEGINQSKIIRILKSVPTQLAKENKKFQYSKLGPNARFRDYEGAIEWLVDTGVVKKCSIIHQFNLPLKLNEEDNDFKIYYHDTGLLIAQYDEETKDDIRANKNLGVYKGAIYENIASEALYKQNIELYNYRRSDSQLELDFIVRNKDEIIPIEVKAGSNQSKSLRTIINEGKAEKVTWGIKFSDNNIGVENNIYTFPLFTLFLLKRFLRQR